MANTLITTDLVTREALRVAHESLAFIGTVDRQYDSSFDGNGGKHGSTLKVRKPNQYTRRSGSRVMDVQDQNESSETITVATQDGVDMRFNSAELALSIDDFSKRYIEPAVKVLVSNIEADFLEYATQHTYNVAGSAGTAITTLDPLLKARAKLNQGLAPKDMRYGQIDSLTMAGLVNGGTGFFNPTSAISDQYKNGVISRVGGTDWYENERVWTLANDNDVTANTNADALVTDGGSTVAVSEDLAQADQVVGSVFTIAGVYAVNPETKAVYGHLQQFVITATGATSVTVSPTIHLTGAKKNVASSTGADLAVTAFNEAAMTFVGAASKNYLQPLVYHKEAFQFVTAKLPQMGPAEFCSTRVQDGLSLRVWQGTDIRNDEQLMRIDILYGMAALRPEWASRLIGSPLN